VESIGYGGLLPSRSLRDRPGRRTYRRVLWAALAINAVMFGVEGAAGILSSSVALKADALDFLGDAANYGISL
jgi:Co/Zn/Cd efflux system component